MQTKEKQLSERLARQPKVRLGFYPTPLCRLDKLSAMFGVNLFVKREDFSGISVFGGNKMRKLEFVFGDVLKTGCDTVFTYGATQSNHAMQTATAARKCGIDPILWLTEFVKPDENDVRANLLLDAILGAEVHIITPVQAADHEGTTKERRMELEAQGHKVYDILGGAANAIGGCGFTEGFWNYTVKCQI
jgi:L-cysteate sulfo-lyase